MIGLVVVVAEKSAACMNWSGLGICNENPRVVLIGRRRGGRIALLCEKGRRARLLAVARTGTWNL